MGVRAMHRMGVVGSCARRVLVAGYGDEGMANATEDMKAHTIPETALRATQRIDRRQGITQYPKSKGRRQKLVSRKSHTRYAAAGTNVLSWIGRKIAR